MSAAPSPGETWHFPTAHIGREVWVFDELPSTNTFAAQCPLQDAADGRMIVAKQQTAGRGRFHRVWRSRPGSSLLMSVMLCPPAELRRPAILTAWAAVAVSEAIERLAGLQAHIKWPNDLLLDGKKVCGILIEQVVGGSRHDAVRTIVGIGLNLNQSASEFLDADLPDATSLAARSGSTFTLHEATEAVAQALDTGYEKLQNGQRGTVEAMWKRRMGLVGHEVWLERTDGSTLNGRLRDMSFDGLELDTGSAVPLVFTPEVVAHVRAL